MKTVADAILILVILMLALLGCYFFSRCSGFLVPSP
jgi:hypothetical protein